MRALVKAATVVACLMPVVALPQDFPAPSEADPVSEFEETLANIDVASLLGLRGRVNAALNAVAGALGTRSPRPKTGKAAIALERLQLFSALTLTTSPMSQERDLVEMLKTNDISVGDFITIEGVRDKFRANYNMISDRMRDLEEIVSGSANVNPAEVSRANTLLPSLRRLRGYYKALLDNADATLQEREARGQAREGRPTAITPDGQSYIPDAAIELFLQNPEKYQEDFDEKYGQGAAQQVLDLYQSGDSEESETETTEEKVE